MKAITESCKIGDVEISIETGRLAKQANSVVVSIADTSVLVTAVAAPDPKDLPFLPLTVEYKEMNAGRGQDSRRLLQARGTTDRGRDPQLSRHRPPDPPLVPQGLAQ